MQNYQFYKFMELYAAPINNDVIITYNYNAQLNGKYEIRVFDALATSMNLN